MLRTTIAGARAIDPGESGLYVIKNGEGDVLYVGQSSHIRSRITQHCSARNTLIGAALIAAHPQSEHWEVNVYTVTECSDLIARYFPYAPSCSPWTFDSSTRPMIDFAEDALIHDLAPRYNLSTKTGAGPGSLPFYQRELHPEIRDYVEGRRAEREQALLEHRKKAQETQDFLVKQVCSLCGQHDTWTSASTGLPCGVHEEVTVLLGAGEGQSITIPLVCHSCGDIINMLNDLKRREENVSRVLAGLASWLETNPSG